MKLSKKAAIALLALAAIYFAASSGFILYKLWTDFKTNTEEKAFLRGRTQTVEQIIQQAEGCEPFFLFSDGKRVDLINVACLPLQNAPSQTSLPLSAAFLTPQQPVPFQMNLAGRPQSGPEDASVTVVEFTDYQCPFCGQHAREILPQLLDEYEGTIKYAIVNFPISGLHPLAHKAAEAAECSHDQGKFWEYHDLLFQNQQALDVDSLKKYARDSGLNAPDFDTCLDSGAKSSQVLQDFQDGQSYGVSGTPTFFINGQRLVGVQQLSVFKSYIDSALGE